MDKKDRTINVLSDITVFTKYARYQKKLKRRETWEEIVDRNKKMHTKKYPKLKKEIDEAYKYVYEKKVLPSMRSLQFGGKPIEISPNRIYNCAYLPIDDWRSFGEVMFLLLGGTGVGYSVQKHHIEKLPEIRKPRPSVKRFLISDNIEGWADAIKAIMKSYYRGTSTLHFDYSDIREKGADLVTSGGKAPGPEPLKACLEAIRKLLSKKKDGSQLTPLEVHDIVCYIADAVLAGGIRRAALISLFSATDKQMLKSKGMYPLQTWSYSYIDGPVNEMGEPTKVKATHVDQQGNVYYDIKVKVNEPGYGINERILYWVSEMDLKRYLIRKTETQLPWYYFQPQRGRANNSVCLIRSRINKRKFMQIWKDIENSGSGEPGFYLTNDKDWGTNPCCVTGDTKIQCENGEMTMKEIVDSIEMGNAVNVWSYNLETNEKELDTVDAADMTRENAEVIELEFTNGETLQLTPDHRVITSNRGEVEAAKLTEDDDIIEW